MVVNYPFVIPSEDELKEWGDEQIRAGMDILKLWIAGIIAFFFALMIALVLINIEFKNPMVFTVTVLVYTVLFIWIIVFEFRNLANKLMEMAGILDERKGTFPSKDKT